jgi:hypothetical protein
MATDACALPQDQLPGSPFFQDFTNLLESNPTQLNYGISVTDIDGDGQFEFVVAGFGAANQAQKWNADMGKFQDVALGNSVLQDSSGRAIGVAACDIDGDGYEELYILNTDSYSGQTQTSDKLIDRDDSGTYSDLFSENQNQGQANYVAGRSCACLDRTGTGRYGVVVANYGGPMRLFEMTDGSRVVKDEAPAVNMDKTTGGRALIAGPLVTNRMDVFANNEGYGGGRRLASSTANISDAHGTMLRRLSHRLNFLFASDGSGSFADIASDLGLLDSSQTGRGTAILDSNGDGLLDIVYGNWNGPHRLFIQEKDSNDCSTFVNKAPAAMTIASPIRTVIVADFDNDGYEEIFWNNIPGENRLFRKLPTDSDWTQVKIGDALEANGYGTGAAVGDFDGDGQLELVIAHGESASQPLSYFRPTGGEGNHWLRVLPLTTQGAPARGATVHLRAGDRTQVRVIDAGSGYLCQMEPVAHFGLGSLTAVEFIVIQWPDGASHTITNPAVDQTLRVSRPSGLVPAAFKGRCSKRQPIQALEESTALDSQVSSSSSTEESSTQPASSTQSSSSPSTEVSSTQPVSSTQSSSSPSTEASSTQPASSTQSSSSPSTEASSPQPLPVTEGSSSTASVVTGDITFSGLTVAEAESNKDVFVAAIAAMANVAESSVTVTIAATRRRRLTDGIIVTYTIATASASDADTIVNTLTATASESNLMSAAADHGVTDVFASVELTNMGAPTAVAATDTDATPTPTPTPPAAPEAAQTSPAYPVASAAHLYFSFSFKVSFLTLIVAGFFTTLDSTL